MSRGDRGVRGCAMRRARVGRRRARARRNIGTEGLRVVVEAPKGIKSLEKAREDLATTATPTDERRERRRRMLTWPRSFGLSRSRATMTTRAESRRGSRGQISTHDGEFRRVGLNYGNRACGRRTFPSVRDAKRGTRLRHDPRTILSAARGVRVRPLDVPGVMPRPKPCTKSDRAQRFFSIVIVISEVSNSVSYGRTVTERVQRARTTSGRISENRGIFIG